MEVVPMTSRQQSRVALAVAFLAAFLSTPLAAADAEAGAREAIRKADLDFCEAVKARDRARFADLVAPEARFFLTASPTGRREEVLKEWEVFFVENGPSLTWTPVHVEASASGDLGYSTGRFELTLRGADGTPRTGTGWYVTIWRKGADGRFRAVLDIGTPPSPKKP
jgi:ketosteroid isomerase-like protein